MSNERTESLPRFASILSICLSLAACSIEVGAQVPSEPDARGMLAIGPFISEITDNVVNISTDADGPFQVNPLFHDPLFHDNFLSAGPIAGHATRRRGVGCDGDATEGFVLTNHHVIDGADTILVSLRDRREVATELTAEIPVPSC